MKGRRVQGDKIAKLLQFVTSEVRLWDLKGYFDCSPAGETGLAVHLLAKTLGSILSKSMDRDLWTWKWGSRFLEKYMQTHDWCPQQIAWIMRFCDAPTACYLARLRRPSSLSHDKCTREACAANDVKLDSTYRQRHVTDGCNCETLSVDTAEIMTIIRQGGIPLVSVQDRGRGRLSLKVCRATPRTRYTSISHVWSDGLGNPTANAIPQCQAEMISTTLSRVSLKKRLPLDDQPNEYGVRIEEDTGKSGASQWWNFERKSPPLFWLDTLCIPIAAPDASEDEKADVSKLKMLAINQMSLVYATAFQVYILDSELQLDADVLDETTQTEFLARLVCCTWMRRCWTLQEGALAKKIILNSKFGPLTPLIPGVTDSSFIDTTGAPGIFIHRWILSFVRLIRLLFDEELDDERFLMKESKPVNAHLRTGLQQILYDVIRTYDRARSLGQATGESQLEQFCKVWNHLAYRNTTQKEDVPVIFANLLDMNAWKILQYPPSERMTVLLRSVDYLPVDLLFNDGPRSFASLDCQNRWIPKWPSQTRMHPSPDESSSKLAMNITSHKYRDVLRWVENGDLELALANPESFLIIQLNGCDVRDPSCPSFVIRVEDAENPKTLDLLVQLDYPANDELQRNDSRTEVLVLEMKDHHPCDTALGCLLRVTKTEEDSNHLTCLYDCPLTCKVATPEELLNSFTASCVVIPQPNKITLQCGDGPRIPKDSQRILLDTFFFFGKYITMTSVVIIGIFFHGISMIIRIVIEARLGWSNLNAVGKAATITFALEASWIFYLIIPPPLAQTLFIISRRQEAGALTSLETAWVVLSFLGNPWIGAFFTNVVLFLFKWVCLKMWRISFQPEWPDNGGLAWKVYLWISRIYAAIRVWLISMEILSR
ncbi:hypothetical protein NM208_g1347 [Fusarium decemcellulare]|uniref:Uncharacterized protein n=2 Tax=Fusarium decemcellulare TaxID=57161 RepID=A0ACC1SWI6_9HYPO|nr:hypothetical protein NM208_g4371 [Fusarium decemcellulare]KAJ3547771.1 hypothetical protein NM208_g1347 [Fusarium decemcellulare]